MLIEPLSEADNRVLTEQLQRRPRGVAGVAYRCPVGHPAVIATLPRLPDGTPFPTTFYLTCPRAVAACSTLEASGLMSDLSARIAAEPELTARYAEAHRAYLRARDEIVAAAAPPGDPDADVGRLTGIGTRAGPMAEIDTRVGPMAEIAGVSAGGMPTRVKCLHALLSHALAAGPGVNPIGDLTLELVRQRWSFPCRGE